MLTCKRDLDIILLATGGGLVQHARSSYVVGPYDERDMIMISACDCPLLQRKLYDRDIGGLGVIRMLVRGCRKPESYKGCKESYL